MDDKQAVELANLLGLYMVDGRQNGISPAETARLTVAEVVGDIEQSIPSEMELSIHARILLNDFSA